MIQAASIASNNRVHTYLVLTSLVTLCRYTAAPSFPPMADQTVEGARPVSKAVEKNRGLTPHRYAISRCDIASMLSVSIRNADCVLCNVLHGCAMHETCLILAWSCVSPALLTILDVRVKCWSSMLGTRTRLPVYSGQPLAVQAEGHQEPARQEQDAFREEEQGTAGPGAGGARAQRGLWRGGYGHQGQRFQKPPFLGCGQLCCGDVVEQKSRLYQLFYCVTVRLAYAAARCAHVD